MLKEFVKSMAKDTFAAAHNCDKNLLAVRNACMAVETEQNNLQCGRGRRYGNAAYFATPSLPKIYEHLPNNHHETN
jgi:hypothetical protein